MTKAPKPSSRDVPAPDRGVDVPDPSPRYDAMQVLQSLVEVQRELTANSTKIDRLIDDTKDLSGKVGSLETTTAWAKGFAVAALVLIPICAGIVWWLVGGQLSAIRDQILHAIPPQAVEQPASPNVGEPLATDPNSN